MNCMGYDLEFWQKESNYVIYYNSEGYEHILKSFDLSEKSKEILKLYFKK